jgi:hypothetical protein
MLTYIVETYGEEKMWKFLRADNIPDDGQLGPLDVAIQATFGISLKDFDQGFQAWLESKEPGEQLDDLRLTIELQELRREYQEIYVAPPLFLFGKTSEAADRDYLPIVMREAHAPANIAAELIIANGQQAIVDGDYSKAEELNKTLADIVATGKFEDSLAKDYLDIVLVAANKDYEIVNLDVQGDHASARAAMEPPILVNLEFQKIDDSWQIQP